MFSIVYRGNLRKRQLCAWENNRHVCSSHVQVLVSLSFSDVFPIIMRPNLCQPPVNDFSDNEETQPVPPVPPERVRAGTWRITPVPKHILVMITRFPRENIWMCTTFNSSGSNTSTVLEHAKSGNRGSSKESPATPDTWYVTQLSPLWDKETLR